MPSCKDSLSENKKDLIPLETLLYITCFIPETRTTVLIPKCIQTWSSSSCAWTFWWSVFLLSSPPTWSRLVQCNHFLVVSKFYLSKSQDPQLRALGCLIYVINLWVLPLFSEKGIFYRRRWLLLPYMILQVLWMLSIILPVLFLDDVSPLVCLLLVPWTCSLTLVRQLSWCL